MENTIASTINNEVSFDDFVNEYFQELDISKNDLDTLSDKEFHLKYKIQKNALHQKTTCVFKDRYPEDYERILKLYKDKQQNIIDKQREIINKRLQQRKEELIDVLLRQTTYSREQATKELENNNYNVELTIKKFLNTGPQNKSSNKETNMSTNQMIFKEIRSFMDKGCQAYERKKELEQKKKDSQETKN